MVNCQAFNYASGPGITLSNLFRGWPPDRLATVHDDFLPVSEDVCRQYYLLGDSEARWTFSWARRLFLTRRRENVAAADAGREVRAGNRRGPPPPRRLSRWVETVREYLNPRDLLLRYEVSENLQSWVRQFSPDLIYTQPANACFMSLALHVKKLTGARLAIHFMDDWPVVFQGAGSWLRPWARRTMHWLDVILREADVRITISRKMAEVYRQRYGYTFDFFHNPAPVEPRPKSAEEAARLQVPARIVYSGVITPRNQLEALRAVGRGVQRLNESGQPARLHIYTQPGYRRLYAASLASPFVVFEDYISEQERIAVVYREADLLVIPLSFGASARRFTALSMPTKTTSYMASGTPVLVYAPAETALADYADRDGWALLVSDRSDAALTEGLRRALSDTALRLRLREKALQTVAINHDPDRVRERFRARLAQAAARPRK